MKNKNYKFSVQPYLPPGQNAHYTTADYYEIIVEARDNWQARNQIEGRHKPYGAEIRYFGEV